MLPFVGDDALWRGGLAGAIPSALCFVASGAFLFASARRVYRSTAAGVAAVAVFATNPNLLYLQSAPMTEGVFYLGLMGLLYGLVLFKDTQLGGAVWLAGAASLVASLTRYEGWFLIPFATLFFLIAAKRRALLWALVFGTIASLAPIYWLAHNQWYFGDALAFYQGPYSAKAIYQRALDQGMARYAGDQDWAKAWLYYRTAALACVGIAPIVIAAAGVVVAGSKRVWWPLSFLLLAPVFYIWSMHSSGTPIFVPQLWPSSYYNTRYALSILPLVAWGAGALVLVAPEKHRIVAVAIILLAAVGPWAVDAHPARWICWKESEVNSVGRRAWTRQAAQFLASRYQTGSGIFSGLGDLAGIYRQAGIPLREVLHEGNGPAWDAATARPDLFLHEQWAIAIAGDKVATTLLKTVRTGPHYECVETIIVKDAPVIEIYRRQSSGQ